MLGNVEGHTLNTAWQCLHSEHGDNSMRGWGSRQRNRALQDAWTFHLNLTLFKIFSAEPQREMGNQNIRACSNLGPVVRREKKKFTFYLPTSHAVQIGPDYRSFVFRPRGREHLVEFFSTLLSHKLSLWLLSWLSPHYLFGVLFCEENYNFCGRILSLLTWGSWLKPQTNLILKWCCIEKSIFESLGLSLTQDVLILVFTSQANFQIM